jgi:hypothetical protein
MVTCPVPGVRTAHGEEFIRAWQEKWKCERENDGRGRAGAGAGTAILFFPLYGPVAMIVVGFLGFKLDDRLGSGQPYYLLRHCYGLALAVGLFIAADVGLPPQILAASPKRLRGAFSAW